MLSMSFCSFFEAEDLSPPLPEKRPKNLRKGSEPEESDDCAADNWVLDGDPSGVVASLPSTGIDKLMASTTTVAEARAKRRIPMVTGFGGLIIFGAIQM
mmetsp:Transcript_11747/g.21384  ORF Transcript_11747/g.21384 Transcript_11747/m.21384 type:complete len:99 (-) Transcript_11747:4-300(-)